MRDVNRGVDTYSVLHHSESFSDEAFAALVEEATRLVVRYLQ